MKKLIALFVLVALLFTGCQAAQGDTENAPPKTIDFKVNMLCDLTDAEGGTLHCGGPNDFGGTIAGTAKGMSGDDPAWFNFTVPYSASYTFETEATDVRIKATSGNPSSLICSGNASITWELYKWIIRSERADVEFNAACRTDSELTCTGKVMLHTEGLAEIGMENGGIRITGASGQISVSFYNSEKMTRSKAVEIESKSEQVLVDCTDLEDNVIHITDGKETEDVMLSWEEWD